MATFEPKGGIQDPGRSRGLVGCRAGWREEESGGNKRDVSVVVGGIKTVIQQTGTKYL